MTNPPPHLPALLALSTSLRAARTQRNMGLRQLANRLGIQAQILSLWETGKRPPTLEDVAHILGFLRVDPTEYKRIMLIRRRLDSLNPFETSGADSISLQRIFEDVAIRILEWAPHIIPEPLQTPDYTHAILQGSATQPDDIDQELFARQVQQLDRRSSCSHSVLLGESATDGNFGSQLNGAAATRSQLSIKIVPTSACFAGMIEPFRIYETAGKVFTVALLHTHNTIFVTEPDAVKRYRSTFRKLEQEAVDYHALG
ncbi:Scr1 family TA system antitoxin-like transcriptional regulator [Amycolatopsis sp. NPDC098790]|uniref:Scr1 family TA system antitoxin-like transcriptional regulator n=1 Tax=Amycolatopsis sp. NPDC098790 TaxID=3363939 RepID=UPI00380C59E8